MLPRCGYAYTVGPQLYRPATAAAGVKSSIRRPSALYSRSSWFVGTMPHPTGPDVRTAGTGVPVPAVGGMFLEGTDDERGDLDRADAGGEVESAHRREQAVVRGDVACAGDVVEEDTGRDPVLPVQRRGDVAGPAPLGADPVG